MTNYLPQISITVKNVMLYILLTSSFCDVAWAQARVVSGKVTDENGSGLPGVNILIKGTTQGIVTDIYGDYTLTVPDDAKLVFNYVGYTKTAY